MQENLFCTVKLNTFLWVRRKFIYFWCLKIVILMHFFSWTVKLSSFSCVKELCRKFQSSDDNGTWPQDTTSLVQEVFLYSYSLCGFIFSFSICSPFSITPDKPYLFIYLFIFQLFHLVSAKVLDSIRLIKIAQVIFYISRPNYLMLWYIFIALLLEDNITSSC